MAAFEEFNPFVDPSRSAGNVVEIRREKAKQDKVREEVVQEIIAKGRKIGPMQLPLPITRRRSA
jgi:hypothetical protein